MFIIDKKTENVNTYLMDQQKRERILIAARGAFLRYGYKRVGMNDLAEAAGISRPALYLVFKNKEEIFNRVYQQWVEQTIHEIEEKIATLKTPEEKLRLAFELWAVRPFEWMQASGEAKELLECAYAFAQESQVQGYRAFERVIVPIVKMHSKFKASKAKVSAEKTAHIISSATRGFKLVAKDPSEIRSLIKGLLTLSLAE